MRTSRCMSSGSSSTGRASARSRLSDESRREMIDDDKGNGLLCTVIRGLNMLKVVGSNPPFLTKPKLIWNQKLGLPHCPYMRRWVIDFGEFAIRLHRWQSSDDHRAFHDHAWNFVTCVLYGSYLDVSPDGEDLLTPGSIRYRAASHSHTVKILKPGTWTLVLSGPPIRRWGFWVKDKLWKRDRYFAVNGHHPCGDNQEPVRLRPDGSII